jgi:hypothetical protein
MPQDESELHTENGARVPRRKSVVSVWIWFALVWVVLLFVFLKGTQWLINHVSGTGAALVSAAGFLCMVICFFSMQGMKRIQALWPRIIVQTTFGVAGALLGCLGILVGMLKGFWWIAIIGLVAFFIEAEVLTRLHRREQTQAGESFTE